MANNKKRYYFAEVTVPDAVITAQGGAEVDGGKMIKNLLDEYIATDGTKYAKALRDFIFENTRLYGWHPEDANKFAYGLTFINSRHYDNYQAYTTPFRQWMEDTHNVSYTYEVKTDVPYEIADSGVSGAGEPVKDEDGFNHTYAEATRNEILENIPTDRGYST
jgi:hypothetical protein